MTSKKLEILPVDTSEFLTDEETIQEYLRLAVEDNDPEYFLIALGNVAKARGMSEIARKSGLSREGLYKALSPNSHPRHETLQKILGALGFEFTIKPISV